MREIEVKVLSSFLPEPPKGVFYQNEKIETIIKWAKEQIGKGDAILINIKEVN